MSIQYLSEADHLERMAKAIYLSHSRRVTLIVSWDRLSEDCRAAFRVLAKAAVDGADQIRAAARQAATVLPQPMTAIAA